MCFIADPITRNDTVMLMAMKIWIRLATQEKRWYFCIMIWEEHTVIIQKSDFTHKGRLKAKENRSVPLFARVIKNRKNKSRL